MTGRTHRRGVESLGAVVAALALIVAGCSPADEPGGGAASDGAASDGAASDGAESAGEQLGEDRAASDQATADPRIEPSAESTAPPESLERVYAVNYPVAYFARRIAGDAIEIQLPVPDDVDPAYWTPEESTIRLFFGADLVLLNGAGYARWLEKVPLPEARLLDTSSTFEDRFIVDEETHTHTHDGGHGHGPGHAHTHRVVDFNTWLDPTLAILQAETIFEAFKLRMPEATETFRAGFEALRSDLEGLDRELEALTNRQPDAKLIASHPVYDYLARRYGWDLRSVHWEPGEMPDDAQWQEFDALREEHAAEAMLWEDKPLAAIVERLVERGVEVVVFRPCGNVPEHGDYIDVMRRNVERLRPVFAEP